MTKKQHIEALKALKEINKLRIKKEIHIDKNTVRIQYKQQSVNLSNGMSLIVSGSMEQHNQIHCTTELLFLVISLEDVTGKDLSFTASQHAEYKKQIANLLKA